VRHFAARLHAFVHDLFRPSDALLTRERFDKAAKLMRACGVDSREGRTAFAKNVALDVYTETGREADDRFDDFADLILRLLDFEGMFLLPIIDWNERRSVSEYWAIRDELDRQCVWLEAFEATRETLIVTLRDCVAPLWHAEPIAEGAADGIVIPTLRVRALPDLPGLVQNVMARCFADDVVERNLLPRHRDRIERHLVAASGGNPAEPEKFTRSPKLPSQADKRDPAQLVSTYLGDTPLADLFDGKIDVTIPIETRFEHQHIVAGSGHGKTQTLQYMIAEDLEAVAEGNRTVIVLDSQGDLIQKIASLQAFAPGGDLADRLVLIDPTDVEYPVSLNLFDVGIERLNAYSQLDRERLTNSILELYDFVLGTLLAAEMTQKQSVIFRYVTRLMLHIPDATIHTLRELMEPGSQVKFAGAIAELSGTARHFFETEFASKEFEQTKKQVLRRLWGILENQTFERMFSHPRSKLDLFSEMNTGKVILINTAKDLLKEQGTEIFGRFFIAMIAQAAQERATLPEGERMPTFVYIDEAADYFDRNIGIILSQARKYRVGMVLAHQYLGQLEPKLQEAFAANTSVKLAGGVSNRDARALGPMLGCEPSLIETQPKLGFAASIRGVTQGTLPIQFAAGRMEAMPRMTDAERDALRDEMRERYAVHYTELAGLAGADDEETDEPTAEETEPPKQADPPKPKPRKSASEPKPPPPRPPRKVDDSDITDSSSEL